MRRCFKNFSSSSSSTFLSSPQHLKILYRVLECAWRKTKLEKKVCQWSSWRQGEASPVRHLARVALCYKQPLIGQWTLLASKCRTTAIWWAESLNSKVHEFCFKVAKCVVYTGVGLIAMGKQNLAIWSLAVLLGMISKPRINIAPSTCDIRYRGFSSTFIFQLLHRLEISRINWPTNGEIFASLGFQVGFKSGDAI